MRILRIAPGLLLLTLAFGVPGAFASPRSTAHASPAHAIETGDLLFQLKTFLVSLWAPEGCELDPWGRCAVGPKTTAPRVLTGAAGCEIDSWGRWATGTTAPQVPTMDAGCEIDPLGRC
ncbi:MAG TPA: hypothetical protein VMM92_10970, partial [Thermoanaerobaculia bacterium]|nr:hypothetical protein [Thermoanaerobaculia bacterium]